MMSVIQALLETSAPWRRLFYVTVILTVTCIWLKPWHKLPLPVSASTASYTPASQPTGNSAGGAPARPFSPPVISAPPVVQVPSIMDVPSPHWAQGAMDLDTNFGPASVSTNDYSVTSYPANTELHLIGVREGALPNGTRDDPASICMQSMTSARDNRATFDCIVAQSRIRRARPVTVTISRTNGPIVLVLMAANAVDWKIIPMSGVKLAKIILSGNQGQDISGVPTGVPVEVRTREASPCNICTRIGDPFFTNQQNSDYQRIVAMLQKETGLRPTSFQGAVTSDRFSISSNTSNVSASGIGDSANYVGKEFADRIIMKGLDISLPEGRWKVLSYEGQSSGLGSDQSFLLNRQDAKQNPELLAIRFKLNTTGSGYPSNLGCTRNNDYVNETNANASLDKQVCYWVGYIKDPFRQDIFENAAKELNMLGLKQVPGVVASSFHRADKDKSLDMLHYSIPDSRSISNLGVAAKWEKVQLANDPERKKYVDARLQWAQAWYQIFKLSTY